MILLLAGTGEALRIARALTDRGLPVTASLFGATTNPADYPCPVRTGGFGGPVGLAAFLRHHRIRAMIDATHPFAARISANALAAAHTMETPLIRVARPEWRPGPGEDWTEADSVEAAIAALPTGARALLTTGRGSLPAVTGRKDIWTALRVVDRPDQPYPAPGRFIAARPPFDEAAEAALMEKLRITHLVSKNAGGAAGRTKLDAATALGLEIVMVRRPEEPDAADMLPEAEIPDWAAAQV